MKWFLSSIIYCCVSIGLNSQQTLPFVEEVRLLSNKEDFTSLDGVQLFVGSSSIRFWVTLKDDYPDHNVLNRGFGGSTFKDLINFKEELIFAYKPSKVFIYEGDNDIAQHQQVEDILELARGLAEEIRRRLPETQVYFIAAKPSVARWDLREKYKEFNYSLQAWASFEEGIHFIDVWTPMCDADGHVMTDLFVGDNLHMNEKGYQIWKEVVSRYVVEDKSMCKLSE